MSDNPPLYLELWAKTINKTGNNGASLYPLLPHLLDTATVARALYTHWLRPGLQDLVQEQLGPRAVDVVSWVCGIHDCGKANPIFQGQLANKKAEEADLWADVRQNIRKSGRCSFDLSDFVRDQCSRRALRRHEQVSALFLSGWETFNTFGEEKWAEIPALGHHGYFDLPFAAPNRDEDHLKHAFREDLDRLGWTDAQCSLNWHLQRALHLSADDLDIECSPTVSVLLSGLTVLADRIASQDSWIAETKRLEETGQLTFTEPLYRWVDTQADRAVDAVDETIGIYRGWKSEEDARADILGSFTPRDAQAVALTCGEGLVTIMAPTGSGKTEAAFLRHSTRDERLVFLLPTMATTNALMKRTQKVFRRQRNVASLAHSSATLEDFYTNSVSVFDDECSGSETGGLFPTSFVRKGLERLLASVTVATVDQALKASLPIKWVHLLLLALANAHVVVDEVHTMDPYQGEFLKNVLYWLGKTRARVTFLTATFPATMMNDFTKAYDAGAGREVPPTDVSFPSLIDGSGAAQELSCGSYNVGFQLEHADKQRIVDKHVEWARNQRNLYPDARIGIICNQVARCQEIASMLRGEGHEVIVLHSSLTALHRSQVSNQLEKLLGPDGTGWGITVVGTQAIEASLDIDLDLMSIDLCPSTSILQRAGRLWRRDDPERVNRVPGASLKTIHILVPHDYASGDHYPYQPALLTRTRQWLENHPSPIAVPDDCQEFVDACTVRLSELDDETDEDVSHDLEYHADVAYRRQTALNRIVKIPDVLEPDQYLSRIGLLSGGPERLDLDFADLTPRLIDRPTRQVITIDATGETPGALLPEKFFTLDLYEPSKNLIRRLLHGSLSISERVSEQFAERLRPPLESKSVLSRYQILDATGIYDPVTGLRTSFPS